MEVAFAVKLPSMLMNSATPSAIASSMCRKFHGAAFATLADVEAEHFRWLRGKESLREFKAENGTTRGFCQHCGSRLTFSSPNESSSLIEIAISAFDNDLPVRPDAHIFVASAANWVSIPPDEPQFEAGRNSPRIET